MTRTASGWEMKLTHPNTGRVIRPDVLSNPRFLPSLNSFAEARIPVRKSEGLSEWPANTDVTLWFDGVEQPIETLTDVEQKSDRTIIAAEGGVELDNRIQKNYIQKRRDNAAQEIIANQTGYSADVDTPSFDRITNRVEQNPTTTADFEDLLLTNNDTDPVDSSNNNISPYQTAFIREGEDVVDNGFTNSDISFSGGLAGRSSEINDDFTYTFTPGYTIPKEEFFIAVRGQRQESDTVPVDYDILLNGSAIISGNTVHPGASTDPIWQVYTNDSEKYNDPIDVLDILQNGDIPPEQQEIEHVAQDGSTDNNSIDLFVVGDRRWYDLTTDPPFDNTVHQDNGYLDGPPRFPDELEVEFNDAITAFVYENADVTSTWTDTTNGQSISVSDDRGGLYTIANNSTSVSISNLLTPSLRVRATLSNHSPNGAENFTPRFGYVGQALEDYSLEVDIRLESLLLDESFDNNLENVLNDIAGNEFIWSYNLDSNGNPQISWTQPGARTASDSQEIEATTTARKSTKTFDSVTVKGSAQSVRAEEFNGDLSFAALEENNIVPASESVYDPSDNTQFERAIDYEMDYQNGEIRILSSGEMAIDTTYNIDYSHEAEGSYPDTSGRELVETIAGVVTDRQAEQLAYIIHSVDPELSETGWTADILIPRGSSVFDPLDALSLEQLDLPDAATPLAVREPPERTPQGIRLRLGGQRELDGAIRQISEQLRTVSRRS